MSRATGARWLTALVLAAGLVGACGDDTNTQAGTSAVDDGDNTAATPDATAEEAAERPGGDPGGEAPVLSILTPPGSADDDFVGASEDLTELGCRFDDGRWNVSGQLRNSSETAATYRVYVSFLDDSSETQGILEIATSEIEPGSEKEIDGDLELDTDGLTCAARVERISA